MDMTMAEVVERVAADPEYVKLSRAAYGTDPRPDVVTKGIASFMRSLVSGTSRHDRLLQGDGPALNAAEKRGVKIALGERGECFHCHAGFNLTNNTFANNGMAGVDTGREKITGKAGDRGKFKGAVSALAAAAGLDRDRAFYPVLTIVIASYYGLFAVMGGSTLSLMTESIVIAAFVVISILGFKFNLWLVVAALLAHGVFDFIHAQLIPNPGVPAWWPGFCLTYDIAAAGCLALILRWRREATLARPLNANSPPSDRAAAP